MSLMAPTRRHSADQAPPSGLRRSIRLFRLFLAEQSDPEMFYASLAEDAVQQVAEHAELGGRTVVDVGGGGGWFTAAGDSTCPGSTASRPRASRSSGTR